MCSKQEKRPKRDSAPKARQNEKPWPPKHLMFYCRLYRAFGCLKKILFALLPHKLFKHGENNSKAKKRNTSIGDKKGFTLVELLMVLGVVVIGGTLCAVSFRETTKVARRDEAAQTLNELNAALDLYRSEFGALPNGSNDQIHHNAVLAKLTQKSYGRSLIDSETISVRHLESSGNGDDFWFSKYKDVEAELPNLSLSSTESNSTTRQAWSGDNFKSTPLPDSTQDLPAVDTNTEKLLVVNATHGTVVFSNPNKYEWIVPDGVSQIKIEAIGAGGSGSLCPRLERMVTQTRMVTRYRKEEEEYLSYELLEIVQDTYFKYESKNYCDSLGDHEVIECSTVTEDREVWGFVKRWRDIEVAYEEEEEYYETEYYYVPGKGGKAGKYNTRTISGLKGGESVFIFVGKGGNNSNGEKTQISINGNQIICAGGIYAAQPSTVGETNTTLNLAGNGGNAQVQHQTPVNRKGNPGCVKIVY